jgi:hypothetical protein
MSDVLSMVRRYSSPTRLDRRAIFQLTHNGMSVVQFKEVFIKIYLSFTSSQCEVIDFRRQVKSDNGFKNIHDVISKPYRRLIRVLIERNV